MAELKEGVDCVLVGEGSERAALESLAGSLAVKVNFVGAVSDEQLRDYFATSPIFVTSSHSEGFGLSLLQAMSAGCAVIASDIGAHRELIEDGENGLIYGSPEDLTRKLHLLLHDELLVQRLAMAARKSAEAYSWSKIARDMRALYEELCRS